MFGAGTEQHVAVTYLAHQTLYKPGSAETQGKGNEPRESAEVDVEVSVFWQATHYLYERIKNHQKATLIFFKAASGENHEAPKITDTSFSLARKQKPAPRVGGWFAPP